MTPLRQAFHAVLGLAALCVAVPTLAEPLAPIGPPTAVEAAAAEVQPPVVAPDAVQSSALRRPRCRAG